MSVHKVKAKPRLFTQQDVEFIKRLKAEGVRPGVIARYGYGISNSSMNSRIRSVERASV